MAGLIEEMGTESCTKTLGGYLSGKTKMDEVQCRREGGSGRHKKCSTEIGHLTARTRPLAMKDSILFAFKLLALCKP